MADPLPMIRRRDFLAALAAGIAGLAIDRAALRGEDQRDTRRAQPLSQIAEATPYTYKQVGDLELKADVWRPDDEATRPVLLWLHGGGLIRGYRADIHRQIKSRFLDAGFAIVSIDYRLAPETKLPGIIDDLRDGYAWLREKGPELLGVDTSRIAVAGDSAGGYLALLSGFCVEPRPAVLVALWGYGDITADWYTRPSQFYRTSQPLVSTEEAWQGMRGPPLASRSFNDEASRRFYRYCRQQGLWTKNISGFDPATQNDSLTPYCPARNVTGEYPPTLLIHGTDDSDVPHSQAIEMEQALARAGVEHRLISIPHAGHDLAGGDPRQVAEAYDAALQFVERHTEPIKP